MSRRPAVVAVLATTLLAAGSLSAHFGMLIPGKDTVEPGEKGEVALTLSFSHPFEGEGMPLAKPAKVGMLGPGGAVDLLPGLTPCPVMGEPGWQVVAPTRVPGVYQFHFEPQPYWEPAEDCFIVHYTKTVVSVYGDEEGWDVELGLKAEIVPLARPFGLYAGNAFQGVVKVDGKAVPHAEVEVEFYNRAGLKAPGATMITQVVKADANGVFTYVPPAPGWWGFAALTTADAKLSHEGKEKDIELGAVLWVHFHSWPQAQ